jgi:hypothetical protein
MLIKSEKDTVLWPVTYSTPRDNGGFDDHTFKAEYRRLAQDRIDAFLTRVNAVVQSPSASATAEAIAIDNDLLDEAFVGWADIKNPDKTEFEVNPTNREILRDLPGMRKALVLGWYETITGAAERKNLKTPRTTG